MTYVRGTSDSMHVTFPGPGLKVDFLAPVHKF